MGGILQESPQQKQYYGEHSRIRLFLIVKYLILENVPCRPASS